MSSLDFVLSPVSIRTFTTEYLDKKPLHIGGRHPGYLSCLYSLPELEQVVQRSGDNLRTDLKVVRCRKAPAPSPTETEEAVEVKHVPASAAYNMPVWLRASYREGYTLVFSKIQRHSEALAAFVRHLSILLNCDVSINAYLTPPDAQGFAVHVDSHDTLILQISGTKLWRLHNSNSRTTGGTSNSGKQQDASGNTEVVVMHEGDALYLPRGTAHEALTTSHASLHLTVGLYTYRWSELLADAASVVAETDPRLRQRVPLSDADLVTPDVELRKTLTRLIQSMNTEHVLMAAIARHRQRLIEALPAPAPLFPVESLCRSLRLETVVQRTAECFVTNDYSGAAITFPGGTVTGPPQVFESFMYISKCGVPFSVSSLPDSLTMDSKILLVAKLVQDGLLVVVHELPASDV